MGNVVRYKGVLSDDGMFDGYSELQFFKKRKKDSDVGEFSRLFGHFVSGVLQGPVSLVGADFDQTTALSVKDGVVHGLVTAVGVKPLLPHAENHVSKKIVMTNRMVKGPLQMLSQSLAPYNFSDNGLAMLATFRSGRPVGPMWRGMVADANGLPGKDIMSNL